MGYTDTNGKLTFQSKGYGMPIVDYAFENRIFFAKEVGVISAEDAQEWADRLRETAAYSELPIVALIDAMDLTGIHRIATNIFMACADTDNLLASVVATNPVASLQSSMIGSSVKRGHTIVLTSLPEAQQRVNDILQRKLITFEYF